MKNVNGKIAKTGEKGGFPKIRTALADWKNAGF